jgi:DNA (cytosine-5)-methyltransferase 1
MNELALFAGAGGGILGGHLLGWRTVCAVEWEPYPASVLCARQNDGFLPPFPVWDDVQTFDGKPWQGIVDVISGGFPCQDISAAGKGAGIDAERSGMWREMARIIHEVRPRFVFVENSPMLTSRGLGRVLGDLAKMGFDAEWGVLGHDDFGGQHRRERIWIVAYTNKKSFQLLVERQSKSIKRWKTNQRGESWVNFMVGDDGTTPPTWGGGGQNFDSRPIMRRNSDGVADGVDRIAAIGNGQVPRVAAAAWEILSDQR